MKTAASQANEQLQKGDITQEQYDGLQREIQETEQKLKSLEEQAAKTNTTLLTTTTNHQRTINMGGIHLTVNGYNVQDDDQLATMVANKINDMMDEDNSVFK